MLRTLAIHLINPSNNLPGSSGNNATSVTLGKIFTIVFVTIGSLSLLMLVIAGFRYVISAGNEEKVATAKRMIIYTLVGVIVSAMAAVIVNTVLGKVTNG